LEHTHQARPCFRRNPRLAGDEVLVEQFVCIFPPVVSEGVVEGNHLAAVTPLPHDLAQDCVFYRIIHQAQDVAGRGVIFVYAQTMRIDKFAILEPQPRALSVHFQQESIDIIVMAFVGEHKAQVDGLLAGL